MRKDSTELTRLWIERLQAHVGVDVEPLIPAETLLEHGPSLLDGIASFVEHPVDTIAPDLPVVVAAAPLAELRPLHGAGGDAILKEYELLGSMLYEFALQVSQQEGGACSPDELLMCAHRLFRAIAVIEQAITTQYVRVLEERIDERDEQLRRFQRMVSHELKNRVGAVIGAGQLLQEEWVGTDERERFASMVVTNAESIQKVVEKMTAISGSDGAGIAGAA